ncbi:hypothetical protein [Virgibacillus ihumii]|uniref:hypothetical protein n=1 Tax=Virgibacillus ihumii TaxID=2686091 RepID=UPI00157C94EE|nr:hypothetical protein [Virgibacillus ihumii]
MKLGSASNLNKLIFYEIEYLNFGRMNLIHFLHRKGFQIEFRIPYKDQYKRSFAFWNSVYRVVTKQEIQQTFPSEKKTIGNGECFALFNESKSSEFCERKNVSVMEFDSQHDFQDYYQRTRDYIVAIKPGEVETIVTNTVSGLYENSVGKFVYHLQYCMYKDQQVQLSYDQFIELITNDWVKIGNANGPDALSLLLDLKDYMAGVSTIKDIKERLFRLQELDLVRQSFDSENSEDTGRNRMKRYMLNPFRTFAFLHTERYSVTIKQLIDLVGELERLCQYLLPNETELMSVNTYMERWQEVLQTIDEGDDKKVWEKIFNKRFPDDWKFEVPEFLQLIYLTASRYDKAESRILSLSLMQEKILQSNPKNALHMTNVTQMNFPEEHSNSLSAFFTHSELKEIIQAVNSQMRNILLHSLWVDYTVEESFSELGIYQLYNILSNYEGSVKFSWIKNLHDNGLRNIYLEILADLYTNGEVSKYRTHEEFTMFQMPDQQKSSQVPHRKELSGKIPGVYWLNHDFCSKKFFLTTFIDQEPIYEQEFHHQFLFSKIGKLFSISKSERDSFRNYIFPMFPHWTFTKKENLIDMEYQTTLRKYKNYENVSYPKELKSLQILRSVYRENRRTKARNQYRRDRDFNDKEVLQQFGENINSFNVKAEPGNHCKMCQYLNSCSEGWFAIDNNNN